MSDHCQECESDRIADVNARCNDMFFAEVNGNEHEGYVPTDLGIGSGDYVRFSFCLECGQIQGDFPLTETSIETGEEVDEDDDTELWPRDENSSEDE